MKIKDKDVIRMIKRVRSYELEELIEIYPQEECEGYDDYDVLFEQLEFLMSKYSRSGNNQRDELDRAREIIKEGTEGFEVFEAWEVVNEYNRLKRLYNKLKEEFYEC